MRPTSWGDGDQMSLPTHTSLPTSAPMELPQIQPPAATPPIPESPLLMHLYTPPRRAATSHSRCPPLTLHPPDAPLQLPPTAPLQALSVAPLQTPQRTPEPPPQDTPAIAHCAPTPPINPCKTPSPRRSVRPWVIPYPPPDSALPCKPRRSPRPRRTAAGAGAAPSPTCPPIVTSKKTTGLLGLDASTAIAVPSPGSGSGSGSGSEGRCRGSLGAGRDGRCRRSGLGRPWSQSRHGY